MRKTAFTTFLISLFSLALASSQRPGYIDYQVHKLDNGLTVILSEDHSTPIVAVDIWYHVGSANEEPGRSGFAHLFEHMMFQGSKNVGKAEHFQLVARAGGNCNGSTTEDRTNYFEVLPANQLELALWLEADRMRSLAITEENFENQRETVKEERRQRVDNQPYGAAFLTSDTLAYDYPPYDHTVIGKMADLNKAKVEEVQAFFDRYYRPANAVLTIVGDIDPRSTLKLVEKYFSGIPGGEPAAPLTGDEPVHQAERRKVVDDAKANVPAVLISYIVPPHDHPDTPALTLLTKILADGESSRLYQKLVQDEKAAMIVFAFDTARKGPGLLKLISAANVGVDISRCEDLIYEELEKIKNEGVTEQELDKVKIKFRTDFIQSRERVLGKAEALQHYTFFHKDISEVNTDLERYMAVTKDDIVRVAKKYLAPANRTVVIARPMGKKG